MTNKLESEVDYSILIEQIKQAFVDVPYPGDDNIISTPEHIATCDECGYLHKSLVGRRRTELIEDEHSSDLVSHAMCFFSPDGWQYYLPVYLVQRINLRIFSSLYFQPDNDPKLETYEAERINRLTDEQHKVLIDYLSLVLKEDSDSEYMYERNKEAVDYWKNNREQTAARNSDAG